MRMLYSYQTCAPSDTHLLNVALSLLGETRRLVDTFSSSGESMLLRGDSSRRKYRLLGRRRLPRSGGCISLTGVATRRRRRVLGKQRRWPGASRWRRRRLRRDCRGGLAFNCASTRRQHRVLGRQLPRSGASLRGRSARCECVVHFIQSNLTILHKHTLTRSFIMRS